MLLLFTCRVSVPLGTADGPRGTIISRSTWRWEREGAARDLIRHVQQARRDAALDVSDRIDLTISGPADVVEAFEAHRDLVMSETLALAADASATGDELRVEVRRTAG